MTSAVAGALCRASADVYLLAEGPVWDACGERLLWVDIEAGKVLEGRLEGPSISLIAEHRFDSTVGAVAVGASGSLLVATDDALVAQQVDGTRVRIAEVLPAGCSRRLNDGSTDPAGRFVVGTLCLSGRSETESLVRLEEDRTITQLDRDLTLSNGLAWSADGRRMFSVDTLRQVIYVRDYDASSGAFGTRSTHLSVEGGFPDGVAMDAEDHLWVAIWGVGQVRRYDPSGRIVETLETDAPNTSAVAFAGDDLRTLVVTTASIDLPEQAEGRSSNSGYVLTARTDVAGLPIPAWSGRH